MRRLLLALIFCAASPLGAQELLQVPAGCSAVATAHNNSCVTTTMVYCSDDTWQGISHRRGRLVGTSHYTANWDFAKWETEGAGAMRFEMVPDTGAAMDMPTLRATGAHEASARFVINSKVLRNQFYVLTGNTRATGEVLTLSGEPFDIYEGVRNFEREGSGATLNFRFEILMSQKRNLMLEGRSSRAVNDMGWQQFDTEPMALRGPGEPGFMATMSEFGCD